MWWANNLKVSNLAQVEILLHNVSELQIRGGIEDNSKIIFLISQQKPMLWPLIRTVSMRRFWWWVTTYVLKEYFEKLSLNYPFNPFLSGALPTCRCGTWLFHPHCLIVVQHIEQWNNIFEKIEPPDHIRDSVWWKNDFRSELQMRENNGDNSKIIFPISQQKHMLWPLIRTVLRQFKWGVTTYILKQ